MEVGSALFIVNLDFAYNNDQKSFQEIMMKQLKDKDDPGSQEQMAKIKNDLKYMQVGLVTKMDNLNLPSIK